MPSAFERPVNPEAAAGAGIARTSGTAAAALASGLLSFLCLFGLGGALAIALGWIAHGEIERSEGRLNGKALASTGIGLGIANVIASVVGVAVLIAYAVRPDPPSALVAPPPPPIAAPLVPAPLPLPAPRAPPGVAPGRIEEPVASLPVLPAVIGKVAIVEAEAAATDLDQLLRDQLAQGQKAGERVILWTVAPGCEPCAAIGRSLPDARMQRALSGVRLVRADVTSLARELDRLGVPFDKIPGFTLLDDRARPLDHIHGGEWDADIPANIAPILDKFLHRTLKARRDPWARPLREGETPL